MKELSLRCSCLSSGIGLYKGLLVLITRLPVLYLLLLEPAADSGRPSAATAQRAHI